MLADVNIVLGVTGSIAAVRTVEFVHECQRAGATVRSVMSPSATSIIHPDAVEFASDGPVITELTGEIEHVDLCGRDGWGDVLVVAPTTANTVGKMAASIDDTPVTTCATTAIGAGMPVVIAPAMHEPMWDHPGVLEAIDRLEQWGVRFVPPLLEEGKAKLADDEAIVTSIASAVREHTLAGNRIVVTSGATSEPIDPVRVLTNRASGRMGRAIAREAHVRGGDVELIHDGPDVHYAAVQRVHTGQEMREAAVARVPEADVLISAAAIGDFEIDAAPTKLDSSRPHRLDLEPAPKVLDAVREANPDIELVGFKAETGGETAELIRSARAQQDRLDAAFVVANDASVMGERETSVIIVDGEEKAHLSGTKPAVAAGIVDRVTAHLAGT